VEKQIKDLFNGEMNILSLQSMFSSNSGANNSTYRESVSTFRFITELMEVMAKRNLQVDVLMTRTTDRFGYDVILHCNNQTKYIQLKTTEQTGKWEVYKSLVDNEDGELVVIYLSFPSQHEWKFDYRVWDKSKIVNRNLNANGKVNITSVDLIDKDIEMLGYYLFQ
jgi:dipeptidyl aminopeptidase/acylaminoacyl peptidase